MHLICIVNPNSKYAYLKTNTKTDPIQPQFYRISEVEGNLLDIETKQSEYIYINPAKFAVLSISTNMRKNWVKNLEKGTKMLNQRQHI